MSGPAEQAGGPTRPGSSPTVLGVLALALRRRRLLLGLPLGAAVAAVGLSILLGPQFRAESRFLPEEDSAVPTEMAGLAAQFGLAPGSSESVDFYVELVRSHDLLRQVALTEYRVPVDEGRDTLAGNLIQLYDIDEEVFEDRLKAAVLRLRNDDIVAFARRGANLVQLETMAPWPALAEAINLRILQLVNEFNLDRRQSRGRAERAFLEEQTEEARVELRSAEEALEAFVSQNRRYAESPETQLEYTRLQRRVSFLQRILDARAQGLEQARIEAVRNIPVITVVDGPDGTAIQTAPRLIVNAVLGAILGLAVAVTFLLVTETLRSARSSRPEDYRELADATQATLGGFTPRGFLGRLRGERAKVPAGSVEGGRDE